MSSPAKLDSIPTMTDKKLQRFPVNDRPWPKPDPIAAVYDVCNSSTRLIILNNKLSSKREGSRLRGQTELKGVFDHPQPERHFSDSPRSAREHHKHCKTSESDLFVPIFPPSIPHPPVWVKKSKIRDSHSNPDTVRTFDKDIKRLYDEISRPPKIVSRREPRLSATMRYLVNDPDLRRGERQYLANIVKVYSLDEMRQQKIHQMNELIYQELCKGYYSPREIKKYRSYFSSQQTYPNTRSEGKHLTSSPRSFKNKSSIRGNESRPQTVQTNDGLQEQARVTSAPPRNKSPHGEHQPRSRSRKSQGQARGKQSDERDDRILVKEKQFNEREDLTLVGQHQLNETEDENSDFGGQSHHAKSSPRRNKHKVTSSKEESYTNDNENSQNSSPGKERNKISNPQSEDGSSSDSARDSGDTEAEKQTKGQACITEIRVAENKKILNSDRDIEHAEIKEANLHTEVLEVGNHDNVKNADINDEIANNHDAGDSLSEESDSSAEESDSSAEESDSSASDSEGELEPDKQNCDKDFYEDDTKSKHVEMEEHPTEAETEMERQLTPETSSGETEPKDDVAKGEMTEVTTPPQSVQLELDLTSDKTGNSYPVNEDTDPDTKDNRETTDHERSEDTDSSSSSSYESEQEHGDKEDGETEDGEMKVGEKEDGVNEDREKENGVEEDGENEDREKEDGENEEGVKEDGEKEYGEKEESNKKDFLSNETSNIPLIN